MRVQLLLGSALPAAPDCSDSNLKKQRLMKGEMNSPYESGAGTSAVMLYTLLY